MGKKEKEEEIELIDDEPTVPKKEEKSGKKLIIILLIVFSLLIIALLLYFLFFKKDEEEKPTPPPTTPSTPVKEEVTITFDTDGGEKIDSVKIEKGKTSKLPEPTKENYDFKGWYLEDTLVNENTVFDKDVTLKAKWEEKPKEVKYYNVTFDSKGGSTVKSIKVECEKELKLPKAPTRSGYNFVSWADKNGKVILDGALLSCEDVTLYANWEKVPEEKKYYTITFDSKGGSSVSSIKVECGKQLSFPKPPTREGYEFVSWYDKHGKTIFDKALLSCEDITLYADWKEVEKPKKYTCPDGYDLKDTTRCVKLVDPEKYCENDWKLVNGECINPSSPNTKGTRTCPSKTYGGWTGTGTYYEAGRGYCGYEELTSYIGQNDNCKNNGGSLAPNNHCYKHIEIDYKVECANNEKMFAAQVIAPGNGGGCYQVTSAKKKCPDGYTNASVYGECAKIVDATLE
jgi:uncharacterized repeat protein (TIGR02543 family)